ncbi:MAG TPA: hypothetical protein VM534_06515 [Thermoanaerobaculia bacterium]|nr:hypothetical protein [Thermoanaerobaculia bacterium]
MIRRKNPDVLVLDRSSLLHARVERQNGHRNLSRARVYRLGDETFTADAISPSLSSRGSLEQAIRRMRAEAGEMEQVFLLLPDTWFRLGILEMPSLPDRRQEADELVRWTFRRTFPGRPEDLRMTWQAVGRENGTTRVVAAGAAEKTLRDIEQTLAAQEIHVSLIEPTGLNIWNAFASREPSSGAARMFLYLREEEFTMALFSGSMPLFHRSRMLSAERPLEQELKLSASYVRTKLQPIRPESCLLASNVAEAGIEELIEQSFGAPLRRIALSDFGIQPRQFDAAEREIELLACLGVHSS